MNLAKFGVGLLFLGTIIAGVFIVFLPNKQQSDFGSTNQVVQPQITQRSAEDLTYAQELRTLTAQNKVLRDELRVQQQTSAQELAQMRQTVDRLNKDLTSSSESQKESIAQQIATISERNEALSAQNQALTEKLTELDELAKRPVESSISIDDIKSEVAQMINSALSESTVAIPPIVAEPVIEKPSRVRITPYSGYRIASSDQKESDLSIFDQVSSFGDNVFQSGGQSRQAQSATSNTTVKHSTPVEPPRIFPVYTLPVTTMLSDATLMTPLIGRIPFQQNVNNPFKFQLVLGKENLAANGHKIPGVAKMLASGYVVGNREQSCVRGSINVLTFIFEDGRISTIGDARNTDPYNGLGYLADAWGKPCIRGEYINNGSDYLKSRSLAAFLSGLANAYGQAQFKYERDGSGATMAVLDGNAYQFAAAQGIGSTAEEIASYVRDRAIDAFDVVYVPQAQKVQIFIEEQVEIDYDKDARKISYLSEQNGVSYD